jgi:hypothetical protein
MKTFISGFQFIKCLLISSLLLVYDWYKLKTTSVKLSTPLRSGIRISVQNCDEDSDDGDSSIRTSLNNSRVSKIDDDNNNESNVTPTLNNSIPRVTPDLKIVNSTPLNHYNHNSQDGLSSRKYRRDLTKLR